MVKKTVNEWFIDTVLGKVAVISWGDPTHPPIVMVHGYMDTAATFSFLQEELPDRFYYVAFDMPGHGKSSHIPVGPPPAHHIGVETVRAVVDHIGLETFVLVGFSMGAVIGVFYSYIFPGKVSKLVLLDPLHALCNYSLAEQLPGYYEFFYKDYYKHFLSNAASPRLFSFEEAVSMTERHRGLTREKAEVVVSRSLVPVTEKLYRFSTQSVMKKIGYFHIQTDMLVAILKKIPPALSIVTTEQEYDPSLQDFADQLTAILKRKHNSLFVVEGHHNIHIAKPEILAPIIVKFLDKNHKDKKAKL